MVEGCHKLEVVARGFEVGEVLFLMVVELLKM